MLRPNPRLLYTLRKGQNLTLRELSAAVGLDHRTLGLWESGDQEDFHFNRFKRLADFYGLQFMDLLEELPAASVQVGAPISAPDGLAPEQVPA